MIITKDFVFIHMPKTGGTFVHGIFKKIIADYKKNFPIKWYWNRFSYKFNISTPIYQKLNSVSYYEYPYLHVKGQHAGVSFISKKYQKLPVISVKRDPIKKVISTYYFRWWERFPILPLKEIKKIFPNYPNISIEEYFELTYNQEMKHFFGNDYREDIGVLSWQFIRMYSTAPLFVYKNITVSNYTEYIMKYFLDVVFFEMDQLSSNFERFLKTTGFSEYSNYFETKERIYPPGSTVKERFETPPKLLSEKIKSKEWILYKFFPEYNL
jgi:hypothetical protein